MKKVIRTYTLFFLLMAAAVFSFFYFNQRTFIWRSDGWVQQIRSLIYNAQWLRAILRNIFIQHQFEIPQWEFALGEGNDIFSAMHFYAIGDPFNLFSVFVPASRMHDYFNLMGLVRVYCAGLAFAFMCHELGQRDVNGILAGAISYDFGYYVLLFICRHTFFLNLLVFLPLLIIGTEHILKGKSGLFLTFAVFLSTLSQVYYLYMLAIMVCFYTLLRSWKDPRKILNVALYALFGVLMAAVIAAPMLNIFLSDNRLSNRVNVPLFYPLSYYAKIPGIFLSNFEDNDTWLCLGYAAPTLVACALLFRKRREQRYLFILAAACLLTALSPFLGHALNCFSYLSNRWCFAANLVFSYTLTVFWHDLLNTQANTRRNLFVFAAAWAIICLAYPGNRVWGVCAALGFLFVFLSLPIWIKKESPRNNVALALVCINLFCNAAAYYTNGGTPLQNKLYPYFFNGFFTDETEEVRTAAEHRGDDDFFRYSGTDLSGNAGLLHHLSSTNYIWSLTNPNVVRFNNEMEVNESSVYVMNGYDGRTAPLALAAVRYYPMRYGGTPPYAYQLHPESTYLYENTLALPLGYTYERAADPAQWENLSASQKAKKMLRAVYLTNVPEDYVTDKTDPDTAEIPFSLISGEGLTFTDNAFIVEEAGAQAELRFESLPNSESYFEIRGLNYVRKDKLNLIERLFRDEPKDAPVRVISGNIKKTITNATPDAMYYFGRKNFLVNLEYHEEPLTSLQLEFTRPGRYSFESLKIISQPMTTYTDEINGLLQNVLEDVRIGTNKVNGEIHLDKAKILCLSIPYSKGWSASVDGQNADLLQANLKYMALPLTPGEHHIELTYHMPLFREGLMISAVAFLLFIIFIIRKIKA